MTTRKWDMADEETQRKCVDEVIASISDIEDTDAVGVIAAQDIIDIVTENLGPAIYNAGVRDVKKMIQEKLQDIEFDIDALEQKN